MNGGCHVGDGVDGDGLNKCKCWSANVSKCQNGCNAANKCYSRACHGEYDSKCQMLRHSNDGNDQCMSAMQIMVRVVGYGCRVTGYDGDGGNGDGDGCQMGPGGLCNGDGVLGYVSCAVMGMGAGRVNGINAMKWVK